MKGAGRMQEIVIREIGESRASDINIKNERFRLFGRMIPAYQNGKWSYSIARNEEESWERFPDENYDYGQMAKDHIFLGAYDGSVSAVWIRTFTTGRPWRESPISTFTRRPEVKQGFPSREAHRRRRSAGALCFVQKR